MSEFERIVDDMMRAYNSFDPNEDGLELEDMSDEMIDTDDEWLDDFQGEEDWG